MVWLIIALHTAFAQNTQALAQETVHALKSRSMPAEEADLPSAIDIAFENSDTELFVALTETLKWRHHGENCADQVLRLYLEHPPDEFKKAVSLSVAFSMAGVARVARSSWSCEFYKTVIPVVFDQNLNRNRFCSFLTLRKLCDYTEMPFFPINARVLLAMPADELGDGFLYLKNLQPMLSQVTPIMAYHLCRTYDSAPGFDKHKETLADKAKAFFSGQEIASPSSLGDLIAELDKTIAENGRKLCEKYDKVELEPRRLAPVYKLGGPPSL